MIERANAGARTPLLDALALGPATWGGLLAQTTAASPFMSWAWHRAWAHSAPPEDLAASEAVLLYDSAGRLQALAPVAARRVSFRRARIAALTWAIGDVGCPDHLDLMATPGADLEALAPALEALPWHVMILSNLTEGAPNVGRLAAALARRGHAVQHTALWSCPYLELPSAWEEYLATLSPTRRQLLRRKERNLYRAHRAVLTDYEADRLDEGWGWLVALHERRWTGAGVFREPRIERLHRRFACEMARRGQLWLTTLDLDGEPAAAWYGFADRDAVYFYQSGRDPAWERESVGLVLMGLMIRRAIERGYRRFEFLRGEEPYKMQWTGTRRRTSEMTVFRRGWCGSWLRILDWAGRLRARLGTGNPRGRQPGDPAHA